MKTNLDRQVSPLQGFKALLNRKANTNTCCIGRPSDERFHMHEYLPQEGFILRKQPGVDFRILNITDPHFADYDYRALAAFEVEATFRRLVMAIQPDLITVTGDMICSDNALYSIKRLCRMFESAGIPWAPVFGNHDDETNMDLNYQAAVYMQCPGCLFKMGDPGMGVGNYTIHIAEETADGLKFSETLIMADSHHSQFNFKQLQWIGAVTASMEKLTVGRHETAVFCHIPLPEYQAAYDEARDEEQKLWRSEYRAVGEKHEEICCERNASGPVYRGALEELKKHPSLKYVFCGHEHLNNFSILYQGVRLTYTMKIGKGSGFGFGLNGGTLITVGGDGIREIAHKEEHKGIITDRAKVVLL
ncbi:MAG: metallophosphoesterase [Clostridia bacterium]|nr:metallophosphoesterase [Clostridia bacterium]